MLKDLIDNKLIEARAIIGFYQANTKGDDDVQLFDEAGQETVKLHMLRQQTEMDSDNFIS